MIPAPGEGSTGHGIVHPESISPDSVPGRDSNPPATPTDEEHATVRWHGSLVRLSARVRSGPSSGLECRMTGQGKEA